MAITKLNELLVKCEAAYQDYEFLTVSHAVNDFCVVTLSSLYLDIIKDHLYCDGKDSAVRKSAQSALWMILDAMSQSLRADPRVHVRRDLASDAAPRRGRRKKRAL